MPATLAIISKIFHTKKERICILFVAHSSVKQFSKLLRGGGSVKHVRPTHPHLGKQLSFRRATVLFFLKAFARILHAKVFPLSQLKFNLTSSLFGYRVTLFALCYS